MYSSNARKRTIELIKIFMDLCTYILSPICLVLRLFRVRVLNICHHESIGHLALEPYIYYLEGKLKLRSKYITIIFPPNNIIFNRPFFKPKVANIYFLNQLKSRYIVISNPILHIILYPILNSWLLKYNFDRYYNLFHDTLDKNISSFYQLIGDYHKNKINKPDSYLKINKDDYNKGAHLLNKLGIPSNSWFITFHCREPGYYKDIQNSPFRNFDISSLELALTEICRQGGYCIRLGSNKTQALPGHIKQIKGVVDYPHTDIQSEFMDIFLIANSKFHIGGPSGLSNVAGLYNVPTLIVNSAPLSHLPLFPFDNVIFKLYRDKSTKKFLHFRTIFQTFISYNARFELLNEFNFELIDNSQEEILEAVLEMINDLNDMPLSNRQKEENEALQCQFRNLMNSFNRGKGFCCKLGYFFVKKYENLINE